MCSIAGDLGTDIEFGRRFVECANQLMFHLVVRVRAEDFNIHSIAKG